MMKVFFPSDPNDRLKTQAEIRQWKAELKAEQEAANKAYKEEQAKKKPLYIFKQRAKKFWALFVGFSAIITVLGWPLIIHFFKMVVSFFQ